MLNVNQILEMAKLMYLNIDGGAPGSWDKLGQDRQDEYINKIKVIVENFGRIGLDVLPLNYVEPSDKKPIDQTQLEMFIKDFIEKKVKKPSGIVNIFPYQLLAYDIAKQFSK